MTFRRCCAGFSTCTPTRLFEILEEGILPGVSHRKGRPGAVEDPGVLKQGLGYDFDHLHELVNEHKTVRKFLGHIWDDTRYGLQTVVDNVSQLTPEVLGKVSQLVAESGHAMVRKSGKVPCGAAAIRSWCTTRRTSTCCGMRCVVWCAAVLAGVTAVAASEPREALSEEIWRASSEDGTSTTAGSWSAGDGSGTCGERRRSLENSQDPVVPCPPADRPSRPPPKARRSRRKRRCFRSSRSAGA